MNPGWFRVDTWFIIVMVIVVIAFTTISVIWGIRAHRKPVSTGIEDLIGSTAVVDTALGPKGIVDREIPIYQNEDDVPVNLPDPTPKVVQRAITLAGVQKKVIGPD